MKFENTQVMNFGNALRGMRNPKNSWDKSDSIFGLVNCEWDDADYEVAETWMEKCYQELEQGTDEYDKEMEKFCNWFMKNGILQMENDMAEVAFIGPNDMNLAQRLIKAGPEHRKFMRQIFVSVDITAPVYWWKELDTYKVATVANSTSSMHTLVSSPITFDNIHWELDDYCPEVFEDNGAQIQAFIDMLEGLRVKYIETKDERYWKELIRWLPSSWLQKRTWTCNYETLLAICSKSQRRNHKLNEWSGKHTPVEQSFIQWARTLPYAQDFIFIDEQDKQEL